MIIGLTGHAQHGKDTVGKVLVEEFGFTRFAFADPLKSMALALDPLISYEVSEHHVVGIEPISRARYVRLSKMIDHDGWEHAKKNPEVRRFLQVLGTEGVRAHLGDDSWINATQKAITDAGASNAVITDARFPNEFKFVRESGWLWKVSRLNDDGTPYDNGIGTDHPSEQHIASAKCDLELIAADIEDLRQRVRVVMYEQDAQRCGQEVGSADYDGWAGFEGSWY